ncbi:Putative HET containing-domain vegetative incompatibility protein [Podospora comata]|uniref:HET containing-domain vegetative incompatibility protein n=1 Tax=Podospora comata TaxID=48703 RepID=A0ABY6SC35_PODCO|nr:Putative HET containing-domain vegetative incompatibility protein [Podospora comata]
MSGAEVIGIISGIIAIVDATAKVYNAANDALGLPGAFRDIATRLPLVRKTLQTVSRNLNNTNPDEEYCKAIKPVLKRCENRATQLDKIFKSVVPQADASRMERYVHAVRTLGKGDTVETLMKGILEDVQLLTSSRVAELPTETSVAAVIREAIEEVSAIPTSLPQGIHLSATCETERDSLLKDLRWTDPTIDKLRIERTKGPLYEDSSRWILSHPNYQKWRDGETKLLWIKGGAGKGKTMLLATIIKQLQSRTKPDHTPTSSSLSFFFCQNTDDRLNNAVAILKGLIYLLLIQDVNLVLYLKTDYDRMGKEIFDVTKNANAFDVLSNVFRQMIQHSRSKTVYLAVDALDECEDGLPGLLGLIRDTVLQQNRLKWIVTSRNGVDIDEGPALENPGAKLSLELNSEAVSQAIKAYIEHKVDQLPSLRSDPTQRDNVQQKLLEKAEGTFLWVDLILRSIHSVLADDAARHIDEIPSGLPPLYDRMMGDIAKSRDGYRDACLTVLSIATLAYRPLHILELRTLTGFVYDTADLEKIVDMCGSFLTLVENHVYPIHQSAKDYLVSHAAVDKIFSSGKHAVHLSIVERSLAAMENALRRDVYQLVHPGTLIHDMKARPPASDPLLGVGYSCAYWIDHVCEADKAELQGSRRYRLIKTFRQDAAGSKSIRIRELVKTFFHRHFLHWLEALSLLGDMANGVLSLTRLRTIVETRGDAFINLVEDAYRFILLNRWTIEQAPLQTYVSALLFTPANSIIRRLFAGEEPSWVLTKPVVEQNWSPCLQTFEGHSGSVVSVAFSPDGSRIVSASNDRTIRIWEAESGKEVRKLEGHGNWVVSVAFSPDGSRIVSASDDRTIRIWEAKSGKEVRKLEGHRGSVVSVAFSPDGSRIVSASKDWTIRIWEAASGSCLEAINVGTSATHISFDGTSRRLITNAGYIKIVTGMESLIEPDDPRGHAYGLGQDGSSIICNGRKVLWLPLEYRARCSAIQGRMISIGCDSGRVFTIGFLRDV